MVKLKSNLYGLGEAIKFQVGNVTDPEGANVHLGIIVRIEYGNDAIQYTATMPDGVAVLQEIKTGLFYCSLVEPINGHYGQLPNTRLYISPYVKDAMDKSKIILKGAKSIDLVNATLGIE